MSASTGTVTVLDMFPAQFNVNGDGGNVLTLIRRLQWAGITAQVISAEPHTRWWTTSTPDIVHLGGGTIGAQQAMLPHLRDGRAQLHEWAAEQVPILGVAGGYHLLLDEVRFPGAHEPVSGIGLLAGRSAPAAERVSEYTVALVDGSLVHGYQNSGQLAYLHPGTTPWGRILEGRGNGAASGTEGAITGSVTGSNLNGPLLPRNPIVADALIRDATARLGIEYRIGGQHQRVDAIANQASAVIRHRLGATKRLASYA